MIDNEIKKVTKIEKTVNDSGMLSEDKNDIRQKIRNIKYAIISLLPYNFFIISSLSLLFIIYRRDTKLIKEINNIWG